jgi:hypothetical protein
VKNYKKIAENASIFNGNRQHLNRLGIPSFGLFGCLYLYIPIPHSGTTVAGFELSNLE